MPPTLRLTKTLWGIEEPISNSLFESIKAEGYAGVEVIRLAWHTSAAATALVNALNHAGLMLVCQVHTTGGFLRGDEYIYCDSYDVERHKHDFEAQLQECVQLIQQVQAAGSFINVHAGVDAWSHQEAVDFLINALDCITKLPQPQIAVTFETHRQRLFGSPFQTRQLLQDDRFQNLKLNADLSHWYCACERVFDPAEHRDATWWPQLVKQVLGQHVYYIHARFGWSQGPQMADPSAPECTKERSLQEAVWKQILQYMMQRQRSNSGICCYVQPEYGPPPYMPVIPQTQTAVASLPNAVSFTKGRIETIFAQVVLAEEEDASS